MSQSKQHAHDPPFAAGALRDEQLVGRAGHFPCQPWLYSQCLIMRLWWSLTRMWPCCHIPKPCNRPQIEKDDLDGQLSENTHRCMHAEGGAAGVTAPATSSRPSCTEGVAGSTCGRQLYQYTTQSGSAAALSSSGPSCTCVMPLCLLRGSLAAPTNLVETPQVPCNGLWASGPPREAVRNTSHQLICPTLGTECGSWKLHDRRRSVHASPLRTGLQSARSWAPPLRRPPRTCTPPIARQLHAACVGWAHLHRLP